MRIFITGASGFVGSFVLRRLIEKGSHEVAILIRDRKAAWRIQDLIDKVTVIEGTLSDSKSYASKLKDFSPDAICHLAWAGVGNSDRNDLDQWKNVVELMELLDVIKDLGIQAFVGLGSQAEYGRITQRIDESFPQNPTTLYGVSKLAAMSLAKAQLAAIGVRFAWLRLFSSYGPTDQPTWLLQYLIKQFLCGISPQVTAGEQMWDYIYVEDVADALISVAECKSAYGVFNLGSGRAYRLRSIIEKTRDLINPSIEIQFGAIPYRSDQGMHLEADISLLRSATGWMPRVSLEEGLERTVMWAKENLRDGV